MRITFSNVKIFCSYEVRVYVELLLQIIFEIWVAIEAYILFFKKTREV